MSATNVVGLMLTKVNMNKIQILKTFRSVKDMTIEEIMNGVINLLSELNCLSDTDEDIEIAKRKVMEVAENIYYK